MQHHQTDAGEKAGKPADQSGFAAYSPTCWLLGLLDLDSLVYDRETPHVDE
jgi:hypothetical protein